MFLITGCSTLYESTSSVYTAQPIPVYKKETNNKGETVYRSKESSSPLYNSTPFYERSSESVSASQNSTASSSDQPAHETSTLSKSQNKSHFKGLVAFTEFARENNNSHIGFHLGQNIIDTPLVPRIGVSLFNSDHQIYAGFDGSIRAHLPNPNFSPFVGAGVYIGDTKKCSNQNNSYSQECEKKFLTSGYTEIGIQIKSVQAFLRNYKINRAGISIPSDQFWGIGLSFGGELF